MSISVQLYSVRDKFAEDPTAALRRLADIGFPTSSRTACWRTSTPCAPVCPTTD